MNESGEGGNQFQAVGPGSWESSPNETVNFHFLSSVSVRQNL